MKRLGLIVLLSSAALASAAIKSQNLFAWAPITFDFNNNAVQAALADLTAKNDPTLKEMEVNFPPFRSNLISAFNFSASAVLQSYATPPLGIFNEDGSLTPDERMVGMAKAVGSAVESVRERIVDQVQTLAAPDVDENEKYNYVYCEQNPTPKPDVCEDGEYSYDWVFARRLISQASFVRNACPAITTFAMWNLNWNFQSPTRDIDYALFFSEADRVLTKYYNNGVWSHTVLGTVTTAFGDEFTQNLERRYLDGGPELMLAMKDCLADIYKAYQAQKPATDVGSTAAIEDILKFTDVPFFATGQTLSIQTAPLTRGTLYRLARHMNSSSLRPPYEMETPGETAVALTQNLTQIDPVYSYRLMTRAEYEGLVLEKQPITKRDGICLVSHNYVRDGMAGLKYFYGYEVGVEDAYNGRDTYSAENFAIIRERK